MIRSPLSSALSSAVLAVGIAVIALQPAVAQQPQTPPTATMTPDPLAVGKQALAHNDYETAQTFFANYLKDNPESTEALLFAGNTALALKQYESAAHDYQSVIAKQPSLWPAHKNLVIAYAAQNKWPEFEQERKFLQAARDRGTPGLSSKDVDVIEVLYAGSERYMVRRRRLRASAASRSTPTHRRPPTRMVRASPRPMARSSSIPTANRPTRPYVPMSSRCWNTGPDR